MLEGCAAEAFLAWFDAPLGVDAAFDRAWTPRVAWTIEWAQAEGQWLRKG
jgi:hypothetical protein